ncbi:cysteine hydrolase [Streptacidiphilus pinicola]|uniref:Cysteine hydrolase n=1 Tax=Streptacidiphilus pinicola TaxID=2219663 RepID=A0A2X0IQT4_9ACTN|nr:cysteine hydrolase [Streptacidiphilus pinicola]RAG85913.1 cysteine hydrolase [Streptacidiphilus pinicola]
MSATTLPSVDPKRTVLLAMDFQGGIVAAVPDSDALVERVADVITHVREAGGAIGYVRVAFTEDDWDAVPATNTTFSGVAAARMLHHEDASTRIDERIAPQDGDITVRKTRFGGISTTDLHQQLTDRDIDTLVLTGISTSGVVLSTLSDAADRDYRVLVLSDGVADPDPEVHQLLLTKVFPSRGHVVDVAMLKRLLEST